MKLDLQEELEIPEGVNVDIEGKKVILKGKNGENERVFNYNISMKKEGNKIILASKKATKREKKQLMSAKAHILNMIKGMQEKYVYKLQICSLHFPITVNVDKGILAIKNFLGERHPRILKLKKNADVKIEKEFITVTANDKELAGQVAADIENTARVRNRDRRVFQDGIFIIQKAGEKK